MTITVICDVLGALNNGTTIVALDLIKAMQARGHQVRIVCPDASKKGMEFYYVVPSLNFGPFQKIVDANGVCLAKADTATLTAAISDADLVHVMMPFSLGRRAVKVARRLNKPITAGFHGTFRNTLKPIRTSPIKSFLPSTRTSKKNTTPYKRSSCTFFPRYYNEDQGGILKHMEFKGSKTEANLQAAFAGESQARNKYTYFASKARKEGYEQIAAIFEETADNEKEHAKLWFKYLQPNGDIGTTAENLAAAAAGENYEWTDMGSNSASLTSSNTVRSSPFRLWPPP